MDGKTVLYIPHEGTVVPVSPTTAKNKELIHRLECTTSLSSISHNLPYSECSYRLSTEQLKKNRVGIDGGTPSGGLIGVKPLS